MAALCVYALWTAIVIGAQVAGTPAPVLFEPPVGSDMGESGPLDIERADFDRDGWPDVAVLTTGNGRQIQFLDSTVAGAFDKGQTLGVDFGSGFASGHFDADGLLDLAVTQIAMNSADSNPLCGIGAVPGILIYRGTTGASRFTFDGCLPGVTRSVGLRDVVTGDFNGDTHTDLAVLGDPGFRTLKFYPGRGDGTFGLPVQVRSSTDAAYTALNPAPDTSGPMSVVDIDRDGDLDVMARTGAGIASFLNFDGLGQFRYFGTTVPTGVAGGILAFAVGDMNSDGVADIAGAGPGGVFVAVGAGTVGAIPTYTLSSNVTMPPGAADTLLSDLNRDGALDLIVVRDGSTGADDVFVFAGHGNGTLAPTPTIVSIGLVAPPANPSQAAVGDWNRDNWPDLAVADNVPDNPRLWALRQAPGVADETPPDATMTAPSAGGPPLAGLVTLMADASDNSGAVSRVEFYYTTAGAPPITSLIAEDTAAPWSVVWNTEPRPNGSYTVTARAFDAAGNSGVSPGVTVTTANADTTAPVVTLTASTEKSWLATPTPGQVAVSATATDLNGVTTVEFHAQAMAGPPTSIGVDTTPPFEGTWNTGEDANGNGVLDPGEDVNLNGKLDPIIVAAGVYSLTATAYDAAGNASTSSPLVIAVNRPPRADAGPDRTIALTPAGNASITGNAVDPDSGDVLSYQWFEGRSPLGPASSTASLSVMLLPGTSYLLELRVTDSYGALASDFAAIAISPSPAPVAAADAYTAVEDTLLTVAAPGVLANDAGADAGASLTAVTEAGPTSGTLTLSANGAFDYMPGPNFAGTDTFTYRSNAGSLSSAVTTVTITVAAANDAPVATNDALAATRDTAVTYPPAALLANDTDIDSATLTIAGVSSGVGGTPVVNTDGSVTFTPAPNFVGAAHFTYTVSDGLLTGTAVATVTVTAPPETNHNPIANPDAVTVFMNCTATPIAVLANDSTAPDVGETLTVTAVTQSIYGGTVVRITSGLNAGKVTYKPKEHFVGIDTFTYTISDGRGGSATATVTVTVRAPAAGVKGDRRPGRASPRGDSRKPAHTKDGTSRPAVTLARP